MKKVPPRSMLIVVPLMLLVNCGFFPIVNFNPDNPVDLGLVMRVMIFTLAASAHWNFGRLEARVFPGWSPLFIGLFNAAVVCGGLLGRYLLEFGEVSNTYNFTPGNTVFHVLFLTAAATAAWKLETLSRRSGSCPAR
nr:hypothetical protein [uncultured Oscillibacter sp.]